MTEEFQIITFYEFREMPVGDELVVLRDAIRASMRQNSLKGTVILAGEGFNAAVCGTPADIEAFVGEAAEMLKTSFSIKSSFHSSCPFRRIDVKIKPEIVTLKKRADISLGNGTRVAPSEWNRLISSEGTFVLDARNEYEFQTGRFLGAVGSGTRKFSEVPAFIMQNLDPSRHERVAMYCTGGIRCEKLAPYIKQLGFDEVYQLDGGILRYLEEIPPEKSLWQGECFVFDDRISVDERLKQGILPDASQAS